VARFRTFLSLVTPKHSGFYLELGLTRPGVRQRNLAAAGEALQRLEADGLVRPLVLFLIRNPVDLVLSRIRHDIRALPSFAHNAFLDDGGQIGIRYLEAAFGRVESEQCLYPFCMAQPNDFDQPVACLGACGYYRFKRYRLEDFSFVAMHERFLEAKFDPSRILYLPLELLVADQSQWLQRLEAFLGIEFDPLPPGRTNATPEFQHTQIFTPKALEFLRHQLLGDIPALSSITGLDLATLWSKK
jgi:hypothetical protein